MTITKIEVIKTNDQPAYDRDCQEHDEYQHGSQDGPQDEGEDDHGYQDNDPESYEIPTGPRLRNHLL